MGAAMVERLLDAGHEVALFNRTRAKAEALEPRGATVVESPALLATCEVVFTMVAGPEDFEAVTIGPGGVLTAPDAAPAVLVDSSTVSMAASEAVRKRGAERGTALVAAPVSGNPGVVRAGDLTIVASGGLEDFTSVRPLLEEIAKSVTYVGEGDRARLVKIAHNLVLGVLSEALAETAVLMELAGVPRRSYMAFLNESVVGSRFTRYKTEPIVELDWTPTFTAPLLRKDLDLGIAAGAEHNFELPVVQTARNCIQQMIDRGHDDVDFQALTLVRAEDAGIELKREEPDSTGAHPSRKDSE